MLGALLSALGVSSDLFDGIPLKVVEHGWGSGATSAAATISEPDKRCVRSSNSFRRGLSLLFEQGGKNLHPCIQICYCLSECLLEKRPLCALQALRKLAHLLTHILIFTIRLVSRLLGFRKPEHIALQLEMTLVTAFLYSASLAASLVRCSHKQAILRHWQQ